MTPKKRLLVQTAAAALLASLAAAPSFAANTTWNGTGTDWNTAGSWDNGVPANVDTALFDSTGNASLDLSLSAPAIVKSITFTDGAGAYTIGGDATLGLFTGGTISTDNLVTGPQTIAAALSLGQGASTTGYTFASNSLLAANTLNITGGITGNTNPDATTTTLTLSGVNTGLNTLSGNLSDGTGALALSLTQTATWLLSGDNSGMTGGVSVKGGSSAFSGATLLIGSDTALGSGTVNLQGNTTAGTVNFGAVGDVTVANDFLANSTSPAAFVGSGNLTINGSYTNVKVSNTGLYNLGTGTLTFGGDFYLQNSSSPNLSFVMAGSGDTTFAGAINNSASTGSTSQFVNLGSGTLTIAGSYNATGKFFDFGGTLVLDTSSPGARLPNAQLNLGGVTLNLSGGDASSNQTVASTVFRNGQTTIQHTNGSTALINLGAVSVPSAGGALVNFGSGAATTSTANGSAGILGAAYTYNGTDWAVSNGATTAISGLGAYTALATGGTTATNDLLTGSGTITTAISHNTLKIDSSGAGQSLALSGAGTYTSSGLLYVGHDDYSITGGTLNTIQTALVVQQWGTGTLTIDSTIADRARAKASLVKGGTGTLILTGANTYTGPTYLTAGTTVIHSDSNLGGQNAVNVLSASTSGNTVTLDTTYPDLAVGSSFLGSTVTAVSGSTVTLADNANQDIGASTSVGFITSDANMTIYMNGGTLSADGTFSLSETLDSQTVNRPISLGVNGGTIDVTPGNTLTVAGAITPTSIFSDTGSGLSALPLSSLTKTGTGALVLGGQNTYQGATVIREGTLALAATGTLASTSYTIDAGAVFDASAQAGYSLAAVATTLGVGGNAAGFINVGTGTLTLGDSLTLNFTAASLASSYDLYDAGAVSGDFSSVVLTGLFNGSLSLDGGVWSGTLGGYAFALAQDTGLLSVTAVPEPAAWAAIAGALALAGALLRRRRQS